MLQLPRLLLARTLWLKLHLYIALIFGLLFSLIGLTGSLSVYSEEIDALFNPALNIRPSSEQMLPLDQILAKVKKAHPNRHGAWTLEMPGRANGTITAWFENPPETYGEFYAPLMVAVNPYNGKIINSRFWGQTFSTWLLDLHSHLQLGTTGREVLAVLAILLMFSVGSGLYLWWPGLAGIKTAFRLRYQAGLMRLLADSHRLVGFFSSVCLLLLAFTGFHLAQPSILESLTASAGMGHGDAGPNVRSTAVPNDRPVSIAEAILVARGLFPSSELRRITTPAGELGTYRINLRQKRELNQRHSFTTVWIDRWSGQIREAQNPVKFSAGQRFTTWQWPLHTGEAFGPNAKLIWFVIGLTPALFWLSGVAYWLHRKGVIADRPVNIGPWLEKTGRQLSILFNRHGRRLLNTQVFDKLRLYLNGLIYLIRLRIMQFKQR